MYKFPKEYSEIQHYLEIEYSPHPISLIPVTRSPNATNKQLGENAIERYVWHRRSHPNDVSTESGLRERRKISTLQRQLREDRITKLLH